MSSAAFAHNIIVSAIDLEHCFVHLIFDSIPEIPSNERKLTDMQEVIRSIDDYITELYNLPYDAKVVEAPKILERLKNIKADVNQLHFLYLEQIYTRSHWIFRSDIVLTFIRKLVKLLERLGSFEAYATILVRGQLKALEERMRLLRDVTEYTTKRSNNSDEVVDLMFHIHWVADNAIVISYSCLVEEMDEGMALEINEKISHLLLQISHINPEVRQSYIRAFKTFHPSDSPWDDKLLLVRLIDFFLLDLTELITPMNGQVENLREEMILVKAILVDRPELRFEPIQYKHLLRSIDEVICKSGPIIYAECVEKVDASTLFVLLRSIKDIRPYVLSLESLNDIHETINLEQNFALLTINWIPSISTVPLNNPLHKDIQKAYDLLGDLITDYNHLSRDVQVVEAPKLLEIVKDLKADVKQLHSLHLETKFVRSWWIYRSDKVLGFVNYLLKYIERLMKIEGHASNRVRNQMEALEQKMRLLRDVAEYTTKRSNNSDEVVDLMFHIRWVADNAMIISYSCLVEEMDEGMAHEINEKISHLLLKISHINPEVRQSYIRAFKTFHPSDSPWDDKLLLVRLIDFFLLDLTELIAPMNGQVENLREEMVLVHAILVDRPELRFEPIQYKHLLRSIDEAICKAGPIIYAEYIEKVDAATFCVSLRSIKDIKPYVLSLESLNDIHETVNLEQGFALLTIKWIPSVSTVPLNNSLHKDIQKACDLIRDLIIHYNHLSRDVQVVEAPKVLERVKDLKADVKQLHALHLETKLVRSWWIYHSDEVLQFVDHLLEYIETLLKFEMHASTRVRKPMEVLKQKVRLLRDVTEYTTKRSNNSDEVVDLMFHLRWVADNAMIISYSCLVEEMDEGMAHEINEKISHLLLKISHINPEVRQSYMRAFNTFHPSDSPWDDKLLFVRLIDFFLLDLIELMTPMNGQIENLQKEMILLKAFLADRPELRFEPIQYKHLLRSVDEVICKVGQIIYAEVIEEEDISSLSTLLKSIKEIRPYVLSLESLYDIEETIDLESRFARLTIDWIPFVPINRPLLRDIREAHNLITDYIIDKYNNLSRDSKVVEAPKLLERVKNLKADVKQLHALHLETELVRSCWIYQSDRVLGFVNYLLKYIESLLKFEGHASNHVRKQMEALEQKMRLLRDVTEYTTKRSNNSVEVVDLMFHIRWVADNAMIISYSCLVEEMDEGMSNEINEKISHLLLKISAINPEVRQSYIRAFKTFHPSDSPWDDKLLLVRLIDFFLLDLKELITPINGQVENLREEMILVKAILMDRPELRFEPIQYKHLLRSIDEVICKAGPIIYAEYIEKVDAATLCVSLRSIKDIRPYVLSLESLNDIHKTIHLEQMFALLTINWIPSVSTVTLNNHLHEDIEKAYDLIRDLITIHNHLSEDAKVVEAPKLLKRLKDLKADVKQLHALHLETKLVRSWWIYRSVEVLGFVNDLLKYIERLLKFKRHASNRIRKQMEALKQKMRLLRDVAEYTTKRSNNSDEVVDLMFHIRWVADNAMIISYSCLVEEMDEGMAHEINEKISQLLLKISHINPEVRQSYIRAFKTFHPSDSPWDDKLLLVRLIDFFLLDLKELITPINGQVENLREEMVLVKAILMDRPELRFEPIQYKHLLRSIDEVICKAGPIIYAEYIEKVDAATLCVSLRSIKDIRPYVLSLESLNDIHETIDLELGFALLTINWIPSVSTVPLNNPLHKDIDKAYDLIGDMSTDYNYLSRDAKVVEAPKLLKRVKDLKADIKQLHALHLETKLVQSLWIYRSDKVLGFVNRLLKYIERLLKFEGHASNRVRKQMEALEQKMRFLRDVAEYTTKRSNNSDEVVNLMFHIRWVADNAMIISYSCLVEEMDEGMALEINEKISHLLLKTRPINPEVRQSYIRVFKTFHPSDDNVFLVCLIDFFLLYLTELMAPMKDQREKLGEEMILLKAFLVDQPELRFDSNKYKYLMRNANEVICKAGTVIFSTFAEDADENTIRERDLSLFDLLRDINFIRANMMRIHIVYDFPSTDELQSFDFFLENLEELLNHRTDLATSVRDSFETVRLDLLYLRAFLNNIKEECCNKNSQDLKDLWRLVIFVTYLAEFFIDSIVTGENHMSQFLEVAKEINLIKTEGIKIYDKVGPDDSNVAVVSRTSSHVLSQRTTPNLDELVVGFEDEAETLVKLLITGTHKRQDIVSIVGMPGLGKTTLARKVYNDSSVKRHFDVRAWVCVSQMYQRKDLLLDLLGNIIELTDQINKKSEHELADILHKKLLGQRYLIVLDDMWDRGAWDALKPSFPDKETQSRILITSRMHDVAKELTSDANIHSLRLFRDDESWMLLEGKVFQKEKCPKDLLKIGKQIAYNCKGLPLAVALAAGFLSGIGNKQNQWKQFAETLSSNIIQDPNNQCMAILELSYMHLPDHLKSCFLYLGAFPEDQEIPTRTLTWLWISEGFIKFTNSERSEEVATSYLKDLIGRNLVIRSKNTSRNGVKACRVHDILRDFCLEKAAKEKFMHRVSTLKELFPHTDVFDYGVDPENSKSSSLITYDQYRLSIFSKRNHFIMAKPFGPNARSLLLFADGDNYPSFSYDASFIYYNFKILRVLDLGCISTGNSLNGVELLIHLRYLSIKGDIPHIPSSIANLWRLEVLIIKALRVEVVLVPDTIWNMLKLRHVHINDRFSFELNNELLQNLSPLDNLESLSTPVLTYGDDVEKLLKRFPNLRKLRCIFFGSWDYSNDCNHFPDLKFLSQLESLKVSGDYKSLRFAKSYTCQFQFPSNLTKLTLSDFFLPWSQFSSIGSLPNLEVLKLLSNAFVGESWDMEEGLFPKLKYLKLESLNIVKWNIDDDIESEEYIPCLERLVLRKCKNLLEIPSCFNDSTVLQMIEVQWCSPSAATSAKSIYDERVQYDENFKVQIYPKEKDSLASS